MKKFYVVGNELVYLKSESDNALDAVEKFNLHYNRFLTQGSLDVYTPDEYIEWLNLYYRDDYDSNPGDAETFEDYILFAMCLEEFSFDEIMKASVVIDATDGYETRIYTDTDGKIDYNEVLSFVYGGDYKVQQFDDEVVLTMPSVKRIEEKEGEDYESNRTNKKHGI